MNKTRWKMVFSITVNIVLSTLVILYADKFVPNPVEFTLSFLVVSVVMLGFAIYTLIKAKE